MGHDSNNGLFQVTLSDGTQRDFKFRDDGYFEAPVGYVVTSGGFEGTQFGSASAADVNLQRNSSDIVTLTAAGPEIATGLNLQSADAETGAGSTAHPGPGNLPNAASGTFAGWLEIDMNGNRRYLETYA